MDSSLRPRRKAATTDFFICFTSRPSSSSSSSSMKISSKSILSPGRAREGSVSLSTSLSRRLHTNRSLRGGQSPMFPTAGKRRGSAFENPEPSSPKVTCIGQVRVKTKKQGKKIRTLSKRRGCQPSLLRRGDINFPLGANINQLQQLPESLPHHRNQRWVHLPLTICEALRGFGAEFSCLFPSCFLNGNEREKGSSERSGGRGSCGAVSARWLVPLNEVEGGKRREVEEEERRQIKERISLRRHVDEEIGIEDETFQGNDVGVVDEEEEGRVSICIPPKNALLLMRIRSDPNRMSALANQFWESPAHKLEDEDEENEESEKLGSTDANGREQENPEADLVINVGKCEVEENPENENLKANVQLWQEADEKNQEPEEANEEMAAEEKELNNYLSEAVTDPTEDALLIGEGEEQVEVRRESYSSSVISVHLYSEAEEMEAEALIEEATLKNEEEKKAKDPKLTMEEEEETTKSGEEKETQVYSPLKVEEEESNKEQGGIESEEEEGSQLKLETKTSRSAVLPDCLLLMRCEPKLSMEVSKETWVCTTDFIRWLPEKKPKARDGGNDPKKRFSLDSKPAHPAQYQPPRSSCSLPAAVSGVSMGKMIEQKMSVAYEPLVLPRCKSEPMRTVDAKLKPETCFWKNRKLEPHRVGVGAAAGGGF